MKNDRVAIVWTFLFLMLSIPLVTKSQNRAALTNDTISYMGEKFYVDRIVTLGYGSAQNKSFAFVFMGSGMTGFTPLGSGFSKYDIQIDKLYKQGRKVYFRGKLLESNVNALGGNKVVIDVEGAIDNSEILKNN